MHEDVEWSHFAYSAYVTDEFYLCNAVMLFASLERLGSKAERVMMYPRDMHYDVTEKDKTSELLLKAREEYRVRLEPVDVIKNTKDSSVWADSFTKLLAFNQTRYKRVLNLDTDGMILQVWPFCTPRTNGRHSSLTFRNLALGRPVFSPVFTGCHA